MFFVVAYPTDAADVTRHLVSVTVDGFTGVVQAVAVLLRVAFASPGAPIAVGAAVVVWFLDPRRVRRIVGRADLDPTHEGPLMAAYVGVVGTLTGVAAAILTLLAN